MSDLHKDARPELYGIMAEFDGPDALVDASRRAHEAGYKWFEAYSPFPVHGLAKAMGFYHTKVPHLVLLGGILGGVGGFGFQYWVSAIAYPHNIGGRPVGIGSWPAFIPVTFECTILLASFFAVLGMLALNGLPRPHHPVFGVQRFSRATQNGFFLCIQSRDKKFSDGETRQFLQSLEPSEVVDVPW